MDRRVLVAFATKHGSTGEIALAVGNELRQAGLAVDVLPAGEVRSLDRYGAVVVGSAVYMGRWRDDGTGFLKRFERDLKARPTWLFSSGPTGGTKDADAAVARAKSFPDLFPAPGDIVRRGARVAARGHATFAGRIGDDMTGLIEKWMPKGDWRDFDAIRSWARGIGVTLGSAEPAAQTTRPVTTGSRAG